jgi:hypothetical protein
MADPRASVTSSRLADELRFADRSNLQDYINRWRLKWSKAMMPDTSYRLYQIERVKSRAEIRRADEQAGRLAAAASSLLRGITRPVRAMRRPSPIAMGRLPRPA